MSQKSPPEMSLSIPVECTRTWTPDDTSPCRRNSACAPPLRDGQIHELSREKVAENSIRTGASDSGNDLARRGVKEKQREFKSEGEKKRREFKSEGENKQGEFKSEGTVDR